MSDDVIVCPPSCFLFPRLHGQRRVAKGKSEKILRVVDGRCRTSGRLVFFSGVFLPRVVLSSGIIVFVPFRARAYNCACTCSLPLRSRFCCCPGRLCFLDAGHDRGDGRQQIASNYPIAQIQSGSRGFDRGEIGKYRWWTGGGLLCSNAVALLQVLIGRVERA